MISQSESPDTDRGLREVCTIRLRRHGWMRRVLRYEVTCRRRIIKQSDPIPPTAGAGVYVRALMALVETLREDGWEPVSDPSDPGRGAISTYSRAIDRNGT